MGQNEKSLEHIFDEVSASPEELEQIKGGASLLSAAKLSATLVRPKALTTIDPRLVSDLSSFFNRGLGALDGGLVFRPDQDTGH